MPLCVALFIRLRAPLMAMRAREVALQRGGLLSPMADADEGDMPTWTDVLGFRTKGPRAQRAVEGAALICASIGYVSLGWASGLTTFCAYNKGDLGEGASHVEVPNPNPSPSPNSDLIA